MNGFNDFVYAALPWALGFIAIVGVAILVLKIRMNKLESKSKKPEKVVVIDAGRRNN